MAIALGSHFTLVLTEKGNVFAFGENCYGQLGIGNTSDEIGPVLVNDSEQVFNGEEPIMLSAGTQHAACVTRNGSMWMWGKLETDRRDNTSRESRWRPERMYSAVRGARSAAVMVACGIDFTLLLTEAGGVWGHGSGFEGQMGLGCTAILKYHDGMTQIDPACFGGIDSTGVSMVRIGMIGVGSCHCMAVGNEGGRLWTWGLNNSNQLGYECHTESKSVNYYGDDIQCTPTEIDSTTFNIVTDTSSEPDPITFVDGGAGFSVVVTASGTVWLCGLCEVYRYGYQKENPNEDEQYENFERLIGSEILGVGGARTAVCDGSRCLIVAHDGSLWGFGSNHFDCDHRPKRCDDIFVDCDQDNVMVAAVGHSHSAVVSTEGRLYTWNSRLPHFKPDIWPKSRTPSLGAMHDMCVARKIFFPERVGLWNTTDSTMALIFAMGIHPRLGSAASHRVLDVELMRMILNSTCFQCRPGTSDGLRRLMGMD